MAEVYQVRSGAVAAELHVVQRWRSRRTSGGSYSSIAASCIWAADARNGAMVLEQQRCQQCHPVRGQGLGHETPQVARDLGARLAPTYGPHSLASDLWNHTPAMWAAFSAQGVMPPSATESDWQDLFAYFYSLQFSRANGRSQAREKSAGEQALHRLPFSVESSERARSIRCRTGPIWTIPWCWSISCGITRRP